MIATDNYNLEVEIRLRELRDFKDRHIQQTEVQLPAPPMPTGSQEGQRSASGEVLQASAQTVIVTSNASQYHRLQKLELSSFDEDVLKWQSFLDSSETTVHLNVNLTDVQRFSYLKSQLESDAARTIDSFALLKPAMRVP